MGCIPQSSENSNVELISIAAELEDNDKAILCSYASWLVSSKTSSSPMNNAQKLLWKKVFFYYYYLPVFIYCFNYLRVN